MHQNILDLDHGADASIAKESVSEALSISQSNHPDEAIVEQALSILQAQCIGKLYMDSPNTVQQYLMLELGREEREHFCILHLDNRNRILEFERLFSGTIDQCTVHVREIVKQVLYKNSAAIILAHNHPSGNPSPSQADRQVTERIQQAMELVKVRVLDHIVVGAGEYESFAENGWL